MENYQDTNRLVDRAAAAWLASLRRDAQCAAERLGGLRGPIRPPQRPWSRVLDQLEAEREGLG